MKKVISTLLCSTLLLIFTSCLTSKNNSEERDYGQKSLKVTEDYDRSLSTLIGQSDVADLSLQQAAFSMEIFKKIQASNAGENIMISPLSITLALAMTMNGSAGATTKAMLTGLGFENREIKEVNTYLSKLIKALDANQKVTLEIANSIWTRKDYNPLKRSFYEIVTDYYLANIYPITTVDIVNQWVADKTHGKIPTIVNEFSPAVALILINAVYFKGAWLKEFKSQDTQTKNFEAPSGGVSVKMMSKTETMPYKRGMGYRAVSIPYKDNKTSLYIILPDDSPAMDDFYANLSAESLLEGFSEIKVNLSIPRFKFEFEQDLKPTLDEMGMGDIFYENKSDFTNFSEGKDPRVDKVIHKTFIEVNEEGSEAAAASAVIMNDSAPESINFDVDRPFYFCIRDKVNDVILFMGHVLNPLQIKEFSNKEKNEIACFSPSQNLEKAYLNGAGCACDPDKDGAQCIKDKNGKNVALICEEGNWIAVEDGPCMPPLIIK